MGSRLATFLIWACVAGGAVHWALRFAAPVSASRGAALAPAAAELRGDVARVWGQGPSAASPAAESTAPARPDAATRFRLLGVVAPRAERSPSARAAVALALISVGGAPARAFREGSRVEGEHWLLRVEPTGVRLGPRGAAPQTAIEIPAPPPPAPAAQGAAAPTPARPAAAAPNRPPPGVASGAAAGLRTGAPGPASGVTPGVVGSAEPRVPFPAGLPAPQEPPASAGESAASPATDSPAAPPRRPGPATR